MRPRGCTNSRAADVSAPIHGWLALQAVRFDCMSGAATRHPIQIPGAGAQSSHGACRSPPRASREAARHIKRFVLLQNVETRARELVRQGLARENRVRPGLLAFVETFGLGAEAQREVGCLDECPGQIFVAVPDVAFAFLLAVAHVLAVHTTRVRSEVARAGEALDRPDLQQNDASQNRPDARYSL